MPDMHSLIRIAVMIELMFAACAFAQETAVGDSSQGILLYFGSTGAKAEGVSVARFDPATGSISTPQVAAKLGGASFIAIHPSAKFLYAVGQVEDASKNKVGVVVSYAIDPASGKLTELNQQSSGGKGPCFVGLDQTGATALVANYGDGVVSVMPVGADGKLAAPTARVQHEGKGPNEKRQAGPHAHSFFVDPTNRYALACDLGIDKVMIYKLDAAKSTIEPNDPPAGIVAPGSGPRHLAFGKSGKFLYVINEMGGTITAFAWDTSRGAMSQVQTVATLPEDFTGTNTAAEVRVHPSGKFLYGSNRGHHSIAIFDIDETTGKLTPKGRVSSGGKTPRNFAIDATGKWLLAANQNSDNVVVFAVDPATGELTKTANEAHIGAPTCIRWVPTGP